MSESIYRFSKRGFKDAQSTKLKSADKRNAILVDAGLNGNHKIMHLHSQKDYTLLPTYLEILSNLDAETETWEIRESHFKDWFRKTFGVNNRFDITSRLEWLSNEGLIEFKQVSNDVLTESKRDPKGVSFDKVYPLEPAETLAPVISNIITNQPTNQQKKEKKKENKFSSDDLSVAEFIFARLKILKPDLKPPNLEGWANEIRLMVEIDNRGRESIKELFAWANQDSFWAKNILSPGNLRKHWDRLSLQQSKKHLSKPQDDIFAGVL